MGAADNVPCPARAFAGMERRCEVKKDLGVFPSKMTDKKKREARAAFAAGLKSGGATFSDVAEILNLKTKSGYPHKERARQLCAKGRLIIFKALDF